jgi:hypothetical protein
VPRAKARNQAKLARSRLLAGHHRGIAPQIEHRLPLRCQFRLSAPLDRDFQPERFLAKVLDYFNF